MVAFEDRENAESEAEERARAWAEGKTKDKADISRIAA